MEKTSINRYTGYYHNRYDGYNSSRGILAACGGTPTADGFNNDGEINEKIWNGEKPINWKIVLKNLEISKTELQEIEAGEPKIITEWWGTEPIKIKFSGSPDRIVTIENENKKYRY